MNRTRSTRLAATLLGAIALVAVAAPGDAHHSSAAYDLTTRATLGGTVKSWQWSNPHCWMTLAVPDGKGGTEDWRLEGGSVSILVRNGWKANIIKPGDKVKVLISTKRDKTPGGEFYTILERNGEALKLNGAS